MKNNSKRILALLLAIVMCVSCVVPVFAETTHNHDEHSTSGTVNKTECQYAIDAEGTHIYVEDADGNPAAHLVFRNELKPTCTEGGYKLYQCTECGTPVLNTSEAITEARQHTWGETVITEATCTTDGKEVTPCTVCDYEKVVVIPAPGHTFSEGVINTDENGNRYVCGDENAYATYTCTVCGETVTKALDDKCEYGDPDFTTPPTCTEAGEATLTCKHCGNSKTVTVYPDEYPDGFFDAHEWILKGEYVKAPTCGTNGWGYAVCKVCGCDYVNADTDNLYEFLGTATDEGHEFTVDVPAKAPTCIEQGYEAHKACKYCGKPESSIVYIEKTGHQTLIQIPASKADCENPAMKAHSICPACNTYFDENGNVVTIEELITAPALGHDYDLENNVPTVQFKPTCTKYGYDIYCCTKCGKLAEINGSEGIVKYEPLDHVWVKGDASIDPTCTTDGIYYYYCDCEHEGCNCDATYSEKKTAPGHKLVEVRHEATCGSVAYTEVSCENCDYYEEKDFGTEKDPNNHDIQVRITTPALCGEIGIKVTYCANKLCGLKPVEEQFVVTHEWGDPVHTDPTCAAPGSDVYTCAICKEVRTEPIEMVEHVWPELSETAFVKVIAPSCQKDGVIILTCKECGATDTKEGEKFDPLNPKHHGDNGKPTWACKNPNHVYYVHPDGSTGTEPCDCHETTIYRESNCYTYELVQYYCSVCDVRYHVITEGTGPNYDANGNIIHKDLVIDVPAIKPTCGEPGWTAVWHCDCCGEKSGAAKPVDKIAHANKQHLDAVAATCTTKGNIECDYCPDCGQYFVGDQIIADPFILPAGHNYVFVDLTCANGGVAAHYECSVCGQLTDVNGNEVTLEDLKTVTGHIALKSDAIVYRTCTTEGYRYNYCEACGEEYYDIYRAALGHNYVKVEAKDPTCTVNGNVEHYICTGCNLVFQLVNGEYVEIDADSVIIPTIDHSNGHESFKDICTDKPEHGKLCVWCEIDYTNGGHLWKDNLVEPSCEIDGYWVKICDHCFESERGEIVRATGHNPEMVVIVAPTVFEDGYSVYMCACGQYFNKDADGNDVKVDSMDKALIETIPALGGLEFSFAIDNAIYSGAEFVNGGRIKLTIFYKAANVDLANVAIRINYNADVLSYVSGDFACDAKDADDNRIFPIDAAAIGGATPGFVVVTAATTGFGQNPVDKNLYGDGIFAEVYFNIKNNVVAGSKFDFVLDTDATLSATHVRTADKSEVEATFNEIPNDATTKALGDIDIDENIKFDNADELEFLDIAFSNGYLAAADINQDGLIGSDDYHLLRDLLLGTKSYEDMCAAAQK